MGVMYLNVLPPLSADGSEGLFSQVGVGWRLKVSLRQPVPVGVFLLLHGGFPLSRSFSSPLGAIGFTVFFLLGRRHGQVVVEYERCNFIFETSSVLDVFRLWTSPQSQLGQRPNQGSLLQPHLGVVAACSFDVGWCHGVGDAPLAAMVWATLLQPPSSRLPVGSRQIFLGCELRRQWQSGHHPAPHARALSRPLGFLLC